MILKERWKNTHASYLDRVLGLCWLRYKIQPSKIGKERTKYKISTIIANKDKRDGNGKAHSSLHPNLDCVK